MQLTIQDAVFAHGENILEKLLNVQNVFYFNIANHVGLKHKYTYINFDFLSDAKRIVCIGEIMRIAFHIIMLLKLITLHTSEPSYHGNVKFNDMNMKRVSAWRVP